MDRHYSKSQPVPMRMRRGGTALRSPFSRRSAIAPVNSTNGNHHESAGMPDKIDVGCSDNMAFSKYEEAGRKIFNAFLLRSWRIRGKALQYLLDQMRCLEMSTISIKAQVECYEEKLTAEHMQNKELSKKLIALESKTEESISSCDLLTTSLLNLQIDRNFLEEKLLARLRENQMLRAHLDDTFAKLEQFKATHEGVMTAFQLEKRNVELLTIENNHLQQQYNAVCKSEKTREDAYKRTLEARDLELLSAKENLMYVEETIKSLKQQISELEPMELCDKDMEIEIEKLLQKLLHLQDHDIITKCNLFWQKCLNVRSIGIRHLLFFMNMLLPAFPSLSMISKKPQ